ncbi:hypothetical protein [Shinella zoogloeoides]|uniref:hypothetical protein n=1 Tax=Shinella zoogloeoides TaxID=352475 RepID=UPI001F59E5B9|nr:hypothetical protein [Shinella zoogloeoides]
MFRAGFEKSVRRFSDRVGGGAAAKPINVGFGATSGNAASFTINNLEEGDTILFKITRNPGPIPDYLPDDITYVRGHGSNTLAVGRYDVPAGVTSKTFTQKGAGGCFFNWVVIPGGIGEMIYKGEGGTDSAQTTVTVADYLDVLDEASLLLAFFRGNFSTLSYFANTAHPETAWRSVAANGMLVGAMHGPLRGTFVSMGSSVSTKHLMYELRPKT